MRALNSYRFYELGVKLTRITVLKGAAPAAEMFAPLMEAQAALDALLKGDPLSLQMARSDAQALLSKLGFVFDKYFIDPSTKQFRFPTQGEMVDAHELTLLRTLAEKFESSFSTDLSRRAIYAVPKRGLFDARDLSEHAEIQFNAHVQDAMGEAVRDDIRAAGRCLAFGLGTSTCFHLTRAIEGVLVPYIRAYTSKASDFDNVWKDGLGRLVILAKDKNGPDARVVALLIDVDARYRASLMHSETRISVEEAGLFFGTASSLIALMIEALPATNGEKTEISPEQHMLEVQEKLRKEAQAVLSGSDENEGDGEEEIFDIAPTPPSRSSKSA